MGVTPAAARAAASAIAWSSSGPPTRRSSAALAETTVGATLPRARLAPRHRRVRALALAPDDHRQVHHRDGLGAALAQLDEQPTLAVGQHRHVDGDDQLARLERPSAAGR